MKDEAFGIVPVHRHPEGDRFLLIQHNAGHWGFPKGHAEAGESPLQAACREFTEETGIQMFTVIDDVSFTEHYVFQKDGQKIAKTVIYFPAWVQTTEVHHQEAEIKNYAWASFDQAMALITFPAARQVLHEAQTYLQTKQGNIDKRKQH
ncbi:MAG: NUDIX domain-containing protein [Cyanobacteria bacterium]|nr:NUDIX domain-containing protein [Cyanobacteriota bacterium]MDW8201641.1 NUDIX domain-containing protein [Cyanobacteriota bacterium SKYGB_h_bin112]